MDLDVNMMSPEQGKSPPQCCPDAAPLRQSRIFSHDGPLEMHWCTTVGNAFWNLVRSILRIQEGKIIILFVSVLL